MAGLIKRSERIAGNAVGRRAVQQTRRAVQPVRRVQRQVQRQQVRTAVRTGRNVERQATKVHRVAARKREAVREDQAAQRDDLRALVNAGLGRGSRSNPRFAGLGPRDLYTPDFAHLVDKANYLGFYDRLWPQVRGDYPGAHEKPPKLYLSDSLPGVKTHAGQSASAYVVENAPAGSRAVHMGPDGYLGSRLRPADEKALRQLIESSVPMNRRAGEDLRADRTAARALALHEWTHVHQGKRALRPGPNRTTRTEGGAEAHAHDIAGDLGWPEYRSDREYNAYMRRARKQLGQRYVNRGQFR